MRLGSTVSDLQEMGGSAKELAQEPRKKLGQGLPTPDSNDTLYKFNNATLLGRRTPRQPRSTVQPTNSAVRGEPEQSTEGPSHYLALRAMSVGIVIPGVVLANAICSTYLSRTVSTRIIFLWGTTRPAQVST